MMSTELLRAQDAYGRSLRANEACFREIRIQERTGIRNTYNELKDAQENQAWGHFAVILGSFAKVIAAGFDPNDGVGRAISGISSAFEGGASFKVKLDESDITLVQGYLQEVQSHLKDTEEDDRNLLQTIHQMEQMLEDARRNADRALSAAVNTSSMG